MSTPNDLALQVIAPEDIAPDVRATTRSGAPSPVPSPRPVHITFPGGEKRALLLSPILPEWDEGAYFAPLLPVLAGAGYSTTIYDTLSLLACGPARDRETDFAALVESWRAALFAVIAPASGRPVDLVGGAALGGTVMQALVGRAPFTAVPRALFVSAPSVVDPALGAALGELAELARDRGAGASLARLGELVRRDDEPAPVSGFSPEDGGREEIDTPAAGRLAAGFSALCGVDVSSALSAYPGRLLHVVGEASRMVVARNVRIFDAARQSTFLVPRAGMRPLTDRQDIVARRVRGFLGGP